MTNTTKSGEGDIGMCFALDRGEERSVVNGGRGAICLGDGSGDVCGDL